MAYCYCNKHKVSWDDSRANDEGCVECLEETENVLSAQHELCQAYGQHLMDTIKKNRQETK